MRELTDKQRAVLRYIHSYRQQRGYSPSYRDMMQEFSISSLRGMDRHIEALERKGLLRKTFNVSRSFVLTAEGLAEVETRYFLLNEQTREFERIDFSAESTVKS